MAEKMIKCKACGKEIAKSAMEASAQSAPNGEPLMPLTRARCRAACFVSGIAPISPKLFIASVF